MGHFVFTSDVRWLSEWALGYQIHDSDKLWPNTVAKHFACVP